MTSPFGTVEDDVAFGLFYGYDMPIGDGNGLLDIWVCIFADYISARESFNNPARDATNATCYRVKYHLDGLEVGIRIAGSRLFKLSVGLQIVMSAVPLLQRIEEEGIRRNSGGCSQVFAFSCSYE